MEREIKELAQSKEHLEEVQEALNLPLEVNTENLVLRDGRRGGDLVNDDVEDLILKVKKNSR